MRVWRKEDSPGRFPEGGGFDAGLWWIWEDKTGRTHWDQVMKTLNCQVRTSIGSRDPWRGASHDSSLFISVQSSRDTDVQTSDSLLEIGRCHWPEGVVFSVSILYLEAESLICLTCLVCVSKWTLDLLDFPWVSEMVSFLQSWGLGGGFQTLQTKSFKFLVSIVPTMKSEWWHLYLLGFFFFVCR